MNTIKITGAWEGCLKNISLEIPKNKLVVFTGLSGSGKSTLLIMSCTMNVRDSIWKPWPFRE